MKSRSFSGAQLSYLEAKAMFDVAYHAKRDYDIVTDRECDRLGISTPYGILPEGHPMRVEGQRLLDQENEARTLMYAAAHRLFDWASESALAIRGTKAQKESIRQAIVSIKKMAHVEKFFIELVDISMKLDVAA